MDKPKPKKSLTKLLGFSKKKAVDINGVNVYSKPVLTFTPLKYVPFFSSHNTFIPKQELMPECETNIKWISDNIDFYIDLVLQFPVCIEIDMEKATDGATIITQELDIKGKPTVGAQGAQGAAPEPIIIGHHFKSISKQKPTVEVLEEKRFSFPIVYVQNTSLGDDHYNSIFMPEIPDEYRSIEQTKRLRSITLVGGNGEKNLKNKNIKYNNLEEKTVNIVQEGGGAGDIGYSLSLTLKLIFEKYKLAIAKAKTINRKVYPLILTMDHKFNLPENEQSKYKDLFNFLDSDFLNYLTIDTNQYITRGEGSILDYPLYSFFNKIIIREKGNMYFTLKQFIKDKFEPVVTAGTAGTAGTVGTVGTAGTAGTAGTQKEYLIILNKKASIPVRKIKNNKRLSGDFNRVYPTLLKSTTEIFYNLLFMNTNILINRGILRNNLTIKENKIYYHEYTRAASTLLPDGGEPETPEKPERIARLSLEKKRAYSYFINYKDVTDNISKKEFNKTFTDLVKCGFCSSVKSFEELKKHNELYSLSTCPMIALNIDKCLGNNKNNNIEQKIRLTFIKNYFRDFLYNAKYNINLDLNINSV